MFLSTRAGVHTVAIIAAALGVAPGARAQDDVSFAGKLITVTVGFEAGNRVDLYARMLGKYMTRHLPGQPNIVHVNKPGAGGVIALNDWNARAEPNGLHVTVGGQTQVIRNRCRACRRATSRRSSVSPADWARRARG